MSNADGVLDQIDHALHDWDTSGDAMRWTPEPPPKPAAPTILDISAPMLRVATAVQEANAKIVRAFTNMAKQIVRLQVQIRRLTAAQAEAEAQIRRTAMHREYHRRQKRRSRR